MSLALESVRETSGMRLIDDPATRLVAQKIIELRQRGLRGRHLSSVTQQRRDWLLTEMEQQQSRRD